MKTRTYYDAMNLAHWRCLPVGVWYPRAERQYQKFHDAFLRRIEAGDRARTAMDNIYDALTMTAPISGKYNLIVDAVNDYRAGR